MLLVVTSLLNAAATVVYVNKEQTTLEANNALQSRNNSLSRDKEEAIADAAAARGQLVAQQQLSASEAAAKQAALDKANSDLAARDADKQEALRNNQALGANLTQLNAQLAIALQTSKDQGQTIGELRDTNAKLVQSQAESDAALASQRELAETYGRQVEYLNEQVKKDEDLIKAYSAVITQNHLNLPAESAAYSTGGTASGQPVSGVVQDKQNINGVTYVTISVGSADRVQPGMEFKVVDTQAQPPKFLGLLTITKAEPNYAIGRLKADDQDASRVDRGDEVSSDAQ
jgi:hypothetical protein